MAKAPETVTMNIQPVFQPPTTAPAAVSDFEYRAHAFEAAYRWNPGEANLQALIDHAAIIEDYFRNGV